MSTSRKGGADTKYSMIAPSKRTPRQLAKAYIELMNEIESREDIIATKALGVVYIGQTMTDSKGKKHKVVDLPSSYPGRPGMQAGFVLDSSEPGKMWNFAALGFFGRAKGEGSRE
jgi:hypothetical protein